MNHFFSFRSTMFRLAIASMVIVALLVADSATAAHAARKRGHTRPIPGSSSIVIDADTGRVIWAENPDRQLHPASLTKMMTLLLTFDAIASRRLRLNSYVSVSPRAAAAEPSKLGIRAGGRIRLEDAVKAVAVKSANDMAIVLAEAVAGSEARMSIMMNERARALGMSRTRFYNASGLHHPGQLSSARDMAILGRYIIKTYPAYYRYFSLRSFAYDGHVHANHNKLMETYDGMDGMKTGYISQSGFNLVASAERGGRRLIGVVFGGRSAKARNNYMAVLLDRGFANLGPARMDAAISQAQALPDMPLLAAVGAISPLPGRKPGLAPPEGLMGAPPPPGVLGMLSQANRAPAPIIVTPSWAVQIGAYQNREGAEQAVMEARSQLPGALSSLAVTDIAPLKTMENGWLFRARLTGFAQDQAQRACTYFRGCLLVPP